MKVILEFDGSSEDFERAFDSMDEQFNINDSIFWEIDYGDGNGAGFHRTEYGDIKITVKRNKVLTKQVKCDKMEV